MCLESVFPVGLEGAVRTREALLPRVYPEVFGQVGFVAGLVRALGTRERFLSGVGAVVFNEM